MAIIASLITCTGARADRAPDKVELQAAYCISAIRHMVDALYRMDRSPPGIVQGQSPRYVEAENQLSSKALRFQAFLLPRMQNLDPDPIRLAEKSGDEDMQQALHVRAQCIDRCYSSATSKPEMCVESCLQTSAITHRVAICGDTSWLPQ